MKIELKAAQDHIDFLESQLLILETENEEMSRMIDSLQQELTRMKVDREYCP